MNKIKMNNNKKKGFTIVELIVSFSLTMIVMIYLLRTIVVISNKENELLTLQEYTVVETELLSNIYRDMKGLNPDNKVNPKDVKIIDDSRRLGKEAILIDALGYDITFDREQNYIIYDDVIYELPDGVKIDEPAYNVYDPVIDTSMISENTVFYVAKINLIVNNKKKSLKIIHQYFDENVSDNDFISDIDDIQKLFESRESIDYLVSNVDLFNQIKNLENYSSDIVPIILSSTAYTNLEKYNSGLPCYLVNDGVVDSDIIGTFTAYDYVDSTYNPNGNTTSTFTMNCSNGICTNSFYNNESYPNNWCSKHLLGNKKINFDKYSTLALDFVSFNNTAAYFKESFGYTSVANNSFIVSQYIHNITSSNTIQLNIKDVLGDYFIGFEHGSDNDDSKSVFSSIFLY